jgi:UDP-N-acetylmuramyl pentapeptide phosphotransferase/UDP-N-acetylglucosamine-1-phosphate transferase
MIVYVLPVLIFAVFAAAVLSAGITWAILPFLFRHALARPNARSSHHVPTPQGAGIAVIVATLVVAGVIEACSGANFEIPPSVFGAALFIAAVGFADDVKSIEALPRLMLQAFAVGAILFTASDNLRIVPSCPLWIERGLLLLAGLWFVNLVNFMDGLDWMTVAEVVPITGAMVLLGSIGDLNPSTAIIAATLFGAILGFAPFNRPVAKIFLGDVGSLPIGLLLGWCLLQLIYHEQFAAALLLPLYYLFDATATLLRRMVNREPFWAAHRLHFYQRATDNGFTVWQVVGQVLALNIALAALAIASTVTRSLVINLIFIVLGSTAVSYVLYRFARRPNDASQGL